MADKATSQRESWWVLQAQSGSHEALNELFKSVQEPLFRYLLSLVKEPHRAEDILQEVFIRIYRKLGWLREPDAFRPWAYQIASREAFRYLQRERRWDDQIRDEAALSALRPGTALGPWDRPGTAGVSPAPYRIRRHSEACRRDACGPRTVAGSQGPREKET